MKKTTLLIFVIMACQIIHAQEGNQFALVKKGAQPVLISSDFKFTEGPAVDREGNIFFNGRRGTE
jgi:gluconolactonase